VTGAEPAELMKVWTGLCQPREEPADPDFLGVYPHVTTVQGNRFRCRGGDPAEVASRLAALFKKMLGKDITVTKACPPPLPQPSHIPNTAMKLIVAIIRPETLEDVQKALAERDVYLMTVTDVRGCGRQRGFTEVYRGAEVTIRLVPKVKLEIAVNEPFVEATIEAIVHAARTEPSGQIGDGKIFVLPLEDCVRIRTGERGGVAIGP